MYYRCYRRRHRFTTILILLLVLTYLFYLNFFKNDEVEFDESGVNMDLIEPVKKNRINMKNYEPPAYCAYCPGENGHGVELNVSLNLRIT